MAMADETQKSASKAAPPATEPAQPAAKPAQDDEPRYDAEGWRERASALGVSQHAITGALYGSDPEKQYSESQIRSLVGQFLEREVGE